jgi:ribonuclease HI
MVKQMRGEYAVKNQALRGLWVQATEAARGLASVRYTAVRREDNTLADQLVNDALDAAAK